jgi:amino-acid N-acetyltransferase
MIEKARLSDVPKIKKLIDYHAAKNEMLRRSLSELYENLRSFFVYREGGKVIGCAALYIEWKDLAEVKSLAVDAKHMKKGVGSKLVAACLSEAGGLGIPQVFTLTTKPEFFTKIGFAKIDRKKLPMKIWGECIRCSKFECCDETALVHKVK